MCPECAFWSGNDNSADIPAYSGALLDRLTHHVNILEMNGDSYRLAQSRGRKGIAIN